MPLLRLETTSPLSDERQKTLLPALSKLVAETIGKPEQYVMVTAASATILMSGKPGDAAFVDLRSIGGLSPDINARLSEKICRLLKDTLGIPSNRVYLNFTDIQAANWGWHSQTFG